MLYTNSTSTDFRSHPDTCAWPSELRPFFQQDLGHLEVLLGLIFLMAEPDTGAAVTKNKTKKERMSPGNLKLFPFLAPTHEKRPSGGPSDLISPPFKCGRHQYLTGLTLLYSLGL